MARIGGNPDITKFSYKPKDPDASLNQKMTLKVSAQMKKDLKSGILENWQEVCRDALKLAILNAKESLQLEENLSETNEI